MADLEYVTRSGSFMLDLAGMGAIEAAGNRKRFGPLPESVPGESLSIVFDFYPSR